MKAFSFAIVLTLCVSGISAGNATEGPKAMGQRRAQAAQFVLPRPSPAELRRCALPHKILNSVARSACMGSRGNLADALAAEK